MARIYEVKSTFVTLIGECQPFLMTNRWSDFETDVSKLLSLLEEVIFENDKKLSMPRKQIDRRSDGIGDGLKNFDTVEPMKFSSGSMAPCYILLRNQLLQAGDWKFVTITLEQINKWAPPSSADESMEAGRQRRKSFRDNLQLDFAVGRLLYTAGGRIPSLFYVWKLPAPDCRSENSNLIMNRSILNDMPKYYGQCHYDKLRRKFGDAL
jgi:hypothetical protein